MMTNLLALGSVAFALASGSAGANAQTSVPQSIHAQRSTATTALPVQGPQHRFFGTLRTAAGSTLTIALRDGRLLRIDASEAFALKRVSQPLFTGKPTVVDGTVDADGVLHATSVHRTAPRQADWGTDK